ncbi:MAG: hypothetical protein K2O34_15710 [Acetatifactor sp.]|nr:hypothetical protein [Acetatifactor sp.]
MFIRHWCVPAPRNYPALEKIIQEEVGAYYGGDRTVDEVADIIDRRIQVYLDENG